MNNRSAAVRTAITLLEKLRRTPMSRGSRMTEQTCQLREEIAAAIEAEDIPTRLARRISLQLVLKCDLAELRDRAVWSALGQVLQAEVRRLRDDLGLVDRQIIVALPKLSPERIERLFEELQAADPRIARTILNAALDAAHPRAMSQRYLAEFHRVTEELKAIDADIARTVANATFMARVPHKKALQHLRRFAEVVKEFQGDIEFVRTVAREAFRSKEPIKAAERFIGDYREIVTALTSDGLEAEIARTLAAIACMGAEPRATAYKLVQNFEDVLHLAQKTHPWVARTIALSACRSPNPLSLARSYMQNYDMIVQAVSVTDTRNARKVACQVFRSDDPLRWAKRYLAQLHQSHTA